MSEKSRYRTRTFKVYLFNEELQLLNDKATALNMTKSAYIRDLICSDKQGRQRIKIMKT
mgnify:CR=1 FL=1